MFPRATNARYIASASFGWLLMACWIVWAAPVQCKKGGVKRTFNVKPKTRDRISGSGGELSAKQEKLGLNVTLPRRVIVVG